MLPCSDPPPFPFGRNPSRQYVGKIFFSFPDPDSEPSGSETLAWRQECLSPSRPDCITITAVLDDLVARKIRVITIALGRVWDLVTAGMFCRIQNFCEFNPDPCLYGTKPINFSAIIQQILV
jgi:hypothetical protein